MRNKDFFGRSKICWVFTNVFAISPAGRFIGANSIGTTTTTVTGNSVDKGFHIRRFPIAIVCRIEWLVLNLIIIYRLDYYIASGWSITAKHNIFQGLVVGWIFANVFTFFPTSRFFAGSATLHRDIVYSLLEPTKSEGV